MCTLDSRYTTIPALLIAQGIRSKRFGGIPALRIRAIFNNENILDDSHFHKKYSHQSPLILHDFEATNLLIYMCSQIKATTDIILPRCRLDIKQNDRVRVLRRWTLTIHYITISPLHGDMIDYYQPLSSCRASMLSSP